MASGLAFAPAQGRLQAWVPVPSVEEDSWSKPLGSDWQTNPATQIKWGLHYMLEYFSRRPADNRDG